MASPASSSFSQVLSALSPQAQRALVALSAAVSLTDDLACWLLGRHAGPDVAPDVLVQALHRCDFVVERNSEWHLAPTARQVLNASLLADFPFAKQVHGDLARLARAEVEGPAESPAYLNKPLAVAYHIALDDPDEALRLYRESYTGAPTGDQWLLGALACEQQAGCLLPPDAVEPSFFRAMDAYSEGLWEEAEPLLERVVRSTGVCKEVAIAAHVLGLILWRKRHQPGRAEPLLRRSLELLEALGDRHGQAQVLHSLGNLIGSREPQEAADLLRRSLELSEALGDRHGQAQVLNSLGNLCRRPPRPNWPGARRMYEQAIQCGDHPKDLAVAHLGLSHVAEAEGDLAAACAHMERAIESQRRSDSPHYVRRHLARLQDLRARLARRTSC